MKKKYIDYNRCDKKIKKKATRLPMLYIQLIEISTSDMQNDVLQILLFIGMSLLSEE